MSSYSRFYALVSQGYWMFLAILLMPLPGSSKCIVAGITISVVMPDQGPADLHFDPYNCSSFAMESTDYGEVPISPMGSIQVVMHGAPDSDCIVGWLVERNGEVIYEGPSQSVQTVLDGIYDEGDYRVWQGVMGSEWQDHPVHSFRIVHIPAPLDRVRVKIIMFLAGAVYTPPGNTTRMTNTIVSSGLLPLQSPYLPPLFTATTGDESVTVEDLSTAPQSPWVDWVFVELRDAINPSIVIAAKSALLNRCGFVVDADMQGPPSFDIPRGYYYVSVRHRNHLGLCTAAPIFLSDPSASGITFNWSGTSVYGLETRICPTANSCRLLAGNVNSDGELKYVGSGNDRDPILQRIGGAVPTSTVSGYYPEDVNFDGVVKYTGANNDRDPILQAIGGSTPTVVIFEQLP